MLVLQTGTGLEEVGHIVFERLAESINPELVLQTSAWAASDMDFAATYQAEYAPTILEPILPENMFLGHIPSLIDAPVSSYPNLSVMASDSLMSPSMMDQDYEYAINFYVELMVKSAEGDLGGDTTQREVNKRIQRTTSAALRVLMADPTLGNNFTGIALRGLNVTDVFIRREERARGGVFYWQGSRLDFMVLVPATY